MKNFMLVFILLFSLFGLNLKSIFMAVLIIVFSSENSRKKLIVTALAATCLFIVSRAIAPSYPNIEPPEYLEGYAYRQSSNSFDFYEDNSNKAILVYYYNRGSNLELEGRRVKLSGIKLIRQKTRNKHGFNIEHYVLSKNYKYALRAKNIELSADSCYQPYPRKFISGLRAYMIEKSKALNRHAEDGFKALVLGRLDKNSELAELSSETGLIHLFVISGFHFGIIYGGLIASFKIIFFNRLKPAYLSSFISASLYYTVLGGSFGASRAFYSSAMKSLSDITNRNYDSRTALVTISILWLIFSPYAIEQSGFQLSFLATFFVIFISRRSFIYLLESEYLKRLLISLFVYLFLSSFIVLSGNKFNPFSFAFACQLSIFLLLYLPMLFIYVLIPVQLCTLNAFMIKIVNSLSDLLFNYLSALKNSNYSLELHPSLALALSMTVLVFFIAALLREIDTPFKRIAGFALCSMILLLGSFAFKPELELICYDLKDGEANLIKYDNHAILYDVGNDMELIKLLKTDGIQKIDYLVLSHADQDHVGIVRQVCEEFDVKEAIVDSRDKIIFIGDLKLSFDRLEGEYSRNDKSLTMKLEYKGTSILFTGDIQVDGMLHALKNDVRCEILKVSHHGSYTDISPHFIAKCQPKLAVIAGGRGKRIKKAVMYNFLMGNDVPFYDTMLYGELRLSYDGVSWNY